MQPSEIPLSIIESARARAVAETKEISEKERNASLAASITRFIVDALLGEGRIEGEEEIDLFRKKIWDTVFALQDEKGVKFLTEQVNRRAFAAALLHKLCERATMSEMPENVRKLSAELRLHLSTPPEKISK